MEEHHPTLYFRTNALPRGETERGTITESREETLLPVNRKILRRGTRGKENTQRASEGTNDLGDRVNPTEGGGEIASQLTNRRKDYNLWKAKEVL